MENTWKYLILRDNFLWIHMFQLRWMLFIWPQRWDFDPHVIQNYQNWSSSNRETHGLLQVVVEFWITHYCKCWCLRYASRKRSRLSWKHCDLDDQPRAYTSSQNGEYPKVAINHLHKIISALCIGLPRKTGQPTAGEAETRHTIVAIICPYHWSHHSNAWWNVY